MENDRGLVQGIAELTLDRSNPLEEFRSAFFGRLDVMREAIEAHGIAPQRFRYDGPQINLVADQALAFGLVLHELETNAIKHGALSNAEGRIDVTWSLDDKIVTWQWREAEAPNRRLRVRKVSEPPYCAKLRAMILTAMQSCSTRGKASVAD